MSRRLTTEEFIERARAVHGDKYDYSKVEYINTETKVCIICPIHGEFWQTPSNHLSGDGCKLCSKPVFDTNSFIENVKKVHRDKYNYSKVEYINTETKVCIICPIHGEFWQKPKKHLKGQGCTKCNIGKIGNNIKRTTEEFIEKAKKIHGDKYDYSKVEYINKDTKIIIICFEHGEFLQTPNTHLRGQGCPKCGLIKRSLTQTSTMDEFIEKAKEVHGNKYDYSKVNYINSHTKICIICPIHGEFWQTPSEHLRNQGCKKCSIEYRTSKMRLTTEEFIKKAKAIHDDRYDYSKVNYIHNKIPICIICPIHGEFWQTPKCHLIGNGCSICRESQLEKNIDTFLTINNIKHEREKKFNWLKNANPMSLDFYLPDYNIAIECQGKQHFEPIDYFGGEDTLIKIIERDELKYNQCKEHGIEVLYYTNVKVPEDYEKYVYTDKNMLLEKILSK